MTDLNFPWNKNKYNIVSEEILLNKLKVLAKPNCKNCYGRGYIGFKEHKVLNKENKEIKIRQYVECNCTK